MSLLYKIYTATLAEKFKEKVEEKGMILSNQTGFRKRMGTTDNIYVLKYLRNRQIRKKRKKLMACFVDLRATFDSTDRKMLIITMRKRE